MCFTPLARYEDTRENHLNPGPNPFVMQRHKRYKNIMFILQKPNIII